MLFRLLSTTLFCLASSGWAAVYYIGSFNNSAPSDGEGCGSRSKPCASLQYWNENRRQSLEPGDAVRFAPGTYKEAAGTFHCILVDEFASGVVFEGRTADDKELNDHETVIIDLAGISNDNYLGNNPCGGVAINSYLANSKNQTVKNVTVRDLKFINPPLGGIGIIGKIDGVVLDRIRITGGKEGGTGIFGRLENAHNPKDIDCAKGGRTVRNIRVVDSEFDHNNGFPGGIVFGCVESVAVERVYVHDACGVENCLDCKGTLYEKGCDDHDGIGAGGAIHMVIRDCEVTRCGEEGIDLGGHPAGKSHHILVERCKSYNNVGANYKVSGGRYTVFRNNYSWGRGEGFVSYSCPHHMKIYNNTFWNEDSHTFMFWQYASTTEVINNIFRNKSDKTTVFVDVASSNTSVIWKNNIVINDGSGHGIHEYTGSEAYDANCISAGDESCANSFEPPPLPCNHGSAAVPAGLRADSDGLGVFQARGAVGQWFGNGSGQGDKWGLRPLFVDGSNPTFDNLHLKKTDTVALNAGETLSGFEEDADKDQRPGGSGWDIGADEADAPSHIRRTWNRHSANPFGFRVTLEQMGKGVAAHFFLASHDLVSITLYDSRGRAAASLVRKRMDAGRYALHWRSLGIAPGVYFLSLQIGKRTSRKTLTKKAVFL